MAFAYTKTGFYVAGNVRFSYGTYTSSAGGTGGNIDVGLSLCDSIILQPNSATVNANANVVNETLPVAGKAVTIVTDADEVGYWFAMGR